VGHPDGEFAYKAFISYSHRDTTQNNGAQSMSVPLSPTAIGTRMAAGYAPPKLFKRSEDGGCPLPSSLSESGRIGRRRRACDRISPKPLRSKRR
jgi:hypothetical protein